MFQSSIQIILLLAAFTMCQLQARYSLSQELSPPETRVGKVLDGWLEYMNAEDDSPANSFNPAGYRDKSAGSGNSRKEFRNRGRQLFGKLRLTRIVAEEDREITVVLLRKDEQQLLVTLYLAPKPDDLIDAVKIEPYKGGDPTGEPISLSDSEIKQRLAALMNNAVEAGFSGAVLLARDSAPLFAEAYGLANRSYKIPNKIDTKFNLGSMNKMFTAVAVMQLVEKNKLALADPLSKYLDDTWVSESIASRIQIRHLLNHTSGLGSYFNEGFRTGAREQFRNLADYKPLIAEEKLAFDPGTNWQYSNTGFLLLGAVIEKVSGATYYDYVQANIYKPAGMSASACFELDTPTENLAYGYWKDDGQWKNNLFLHVIKGGSAGGGYSTVTDLLRFSDAIKNGKLLSRESTRTMVTPKPGSPRYGYGFEVQRTPTGLVVGHSGGFPGIEANLTLFLDKRVTLVVLCNAEDSMGLILDDLRGLVAAMKN